MEEEFNAFDIGKHYLMLQAIGVKDEDIGKPLRRFVEAFAPLVAFDGNVAFGVDGDCEEKHLPPKPKGK